VPISHHRGPALLQAATDYHDGRAPLSDTAGRLEPDASCGSRHNANSFVHGRCMIHVRPMRCTTLGRPEAAKMTVKQDGIVRPKVNGKVPLFEGGGLSFTVAAQRSAGGHNGVRHRFA